jgi:hypothetical protein
LEKPFFFQTVQDGVKRPWAELITMLAKLSDHLEPINRASRSMIENVQAHKP